MKTGEDFRREFLDVETGFKDAADQTLRELPEGNDKRIVWFRPVIAIALVLSLLLGVGVAATWERWSLDDFIPTGRITAGQDEWEQIVSAFEPVTVQGDVADITVREVLFDGFAIYMVVDLMPKDATLFLVPYLTDPEKTAGKVVDGFPMDVTLQEHIQAMGYKGLCTVDISTGLPVLSFMPEMRVNEDGSYTFYLRQRFNSGQPQMGELSLSLRIVLQGHTLRASYMTIPVTVPVLPVLEQAQSPAGESHIFANSGMRLSNVCMYRTALSTYVTADLEMIDQAAFDAHYSSYSINFFDTDEQLIGIGPFNLAGVIPDSTGGWYYCHTLTLKELPDTLILAECLWGARDMQGVTEAWTLQLGKVK